VPPQLHEQQHGKRGTKGSFRTRLNEPARHDQAKYQRGHGSDHEAQQHILKDSCSETAKAFRHAKLGQGAEPRDAAVKETEHGADEPSHSESGRQS